MKHIISSILFLLILLCLSVFVFDPSNLYFEIPWLDVPMHILGGFGVASLVISVFAYRKHKASFVVVLALYLCVAVGWEFYELAHALVRAISWNGWPDTLSDIFNGAIGASVAFFLLKK
jgi:hypothetical protein